MTQHQKPPVCLTIAGLDPSGGAGVVADVRAFSAFGCFAAAAVSSVTFQNTTGVFGAVHQTAESVRQQVQPVIDDYELGAVKTGMLPTGEIIGEVARLIADNALKNIVVDPVVRSTSGFDLIDDAALRILIEKLFPIAGLITPNLAEAERIAQISIRSEADIITAAAIMHGQGARNVLIKGGHLSEQVKSEKVEVKSARDFLFREGELTVFEAEFYETTATHGTGCVLSSAIAANLALGRDLGESVQIAKDFVNHAIRTSPGLGRGNSPINI